VQDGQPDHGNVTPVIVVTQAGSYWRLIDSVSLNLRLKDLLGPVTRVKKREGER